MRAFLGRAARPAMVAVVTVLALVVVAPPSAGGRQVAQPAASARYVTIAFTGDILATHATWAVAHGYAGGHGYDYRPMLSRLRPLLTSADIAICHLETPLTGPGVPLSTFPRYAVPHQIAAAIARAGYDGCSTASNHALDHGLPGIRSTLDALDRIGLRHTGTARSERERRKIAWYVVGDVKIAHLSFTASFNGLTPAQPWEANRIDVARIVSDARRARRQGADIVILSLHWGTEFQHTPDAWQQDLARRLLGSGAIDLIVGHHPHVIQPIRRVAQRWVAYSLGNSMSGMTDQLFPTGVQDGVVLFVRFVEGPRGWHAASVRYAPTWVTPSSFLVRPVGPTVDAGRLPGWELAELRRSWQRTVHWIDAADLGVRPIRGDRL